MAVPDGVVDLLQKLKAMTVENGCTPAEAQNAAARLHAMLVKHQLDIADVGSAELGEKVVEGRIERESHRQFKPAHVQYAVSIATAFDCRVVFGPHSIAFIGLESDSQVARWFFETTLEPIVTAGRNIGRVKGLRGPGLISYYEQFLFGAGVAVGKRLDDERKKFSTDDGRVAALIPMKKERVKQHFDQHYGNLRVVDDQWKEGEGASAGYNFGMNLPLQRGLEGPPPANAPRALEAG